MKSMEQIKITPITAGQWQMYRDYDDDTTPPRFQNRDEMAERATKYLETAINEYRKPWDILDAWHKLCDADYEISGYGITDTEGRVCAQIAIETYLELGSNFDW